MDARAARAYLGGRGDADPDRPVYFGESLGAAVAVAFAAEQPPAALVLRSPFTSLADMGRLHYPFLPVVGFLLRDPFDSIERIRRVRCPLLIIAGEQDQVVPPAHSRRLYEAASDPKQFELIPGADHKLRRTITNEWGLIIGGVLSVLFGIVLVGGAGCGGAGGRVAHRRLCRAVRGDAADAVVATAEPRATPPQRRSDFRAGATA